MEKIKKYLKKVPLLYLFIKKIYGVFFLIWERVLNIKIDDKEEKRWEFRHKGEGENWAIDGYWDVRNHPATHFLIDRLSQLAPFSSILEIGCNCGPNLFSIANKFPATEIKGIDINPNAVCQGQKLLARENIKNVELLVEKAYDLKIFPDKKFDIVFSKAVLTHIGPSKIHQVAREMARLAKRKIILIEQCCDGKNDINGDGERANYSYRWNRNYKALFSEFFPEKQIDISAISDDIWQGGNWAKIEITV